MKLSTESVHSARALATWIVRAVAVTLITCGVYFFLRRAIFGLFQRDLELTFNVWQGIGERDQTSGGLAMIAVGVALALLSRRIVRWAIVPAQSGCAACGYPEVEGGVCPECGGRE